MKSKNQIIRTWRGWTTLENAKAYEEFLVNEVFPEVHRKGVNGLKKVSISRQLKNNEVEFLLFLQFESIDDVKKFAGEEYKTAYIPEKAKQLLLRYEKTAEHHEFIQELIF